MRESHVSLNELISLIFRDGAIYLVIMALANSANVLTYYVLAPDLKGAIGTVSTQISVVLLSRAMLNIRRYGTISRRVPGSETSDGISGQMAFTTNFPVASGMEVLKTSTVMDAHPSSGIDSGSSSFRPSQQPLPMGKPCGPEDVTRLNPC
ncbi:hypothetical protein NLI96_g3122 [Meripilus lineatus]|uniref:Uncharacterized protein n=1 Tax=Meripilus lineatus TaxID=2056292 RepID=A0AAD5V7I8_9APHY|nr:hypothetical protein NLI96_g3122 [Physisporinus lineatus]